MPKSISTLAEEILDQDFAQIQEGKISVPDTELPQAPQEQRDISNVEVPSDFMSSILGESKKEVVEDSLKEPKNTQQDIQEYDILGRKKTKILLDKFDSLIKEARGVIEELTSVGMLGTTSADPKAKKKDSKPNPWAVCHSSTGSKKTAKFERCVKQVKKKHGIK